MMAGSKNRGIPFTDGVLPNGTFETGGAEAIGNPELAGKPGLDGNPPPGKPGPEIGKPGPAGKPEEEIGDEPSSIGELLATMSPAFGSNGC